MAVEFAARATEVVQAKMGWVDQWVAVFALMYVGQLAAVVEMVDYP